MAITSYFRLIVVKRTACYAVDMFVAAGPRMVLKWRSADGFVISENCKTSRLHKMGLVLGLAESHMHTHTEVEYFTETCTWIGFLYLHKNSLHCDLFVVENWRNVHF